MSNSLYDQIYKKIRSEINNGKYSVGEMLPSENALGKLFNTTRMTVRSALIRLADEGYIYPIVGKGYYVNEKKFNLYSLDYDEINLMNFIIDETKLITVDIIKPDVDISYNLKLPSDSRVVLLRRLLFIDKKKVAYDEKFIPYYSGMPIDEASINQATLSELIANKESLFTTKKKLMIDFIESNKEINKILDFDKVQTCCRIQLTIHDDEGEPLGWSRLFCQMDYFKIDCKLLLNK